MDDESGESMEPIWEKCKGLLLSTTLAGDINRQHTFKASAQHSAQQQM